MRRDWLVPAAVVVVGVVLAVLAGDWASGAGVVAAAFTLVAAYYALRTTEVARDSAKDARQAAQDARDALLFIFRPYGRLLTHFPPLDHVPDYAGIADTEPIVAFTVKGEGRYNNVRVGWVLKDGRNQEPIPARPLIDGEYRAGVPNYAVMTEERGGPSDLWWVDNVQTLTILVDEFRTQSTWQASIAAGDSRFGVTAEQGVTFELV